MKNLRKLVEGLYVNDARDVSEALTKLLEADEESIVLIVLREAIDNKRLSAGSKTAAIICGIISESRPDNDLLRRLAAQLNDASNNSFRGWIDVVLSTNTGLSLDQWLKAYNRSRDVQVVRLLFKQASYSSAIEEPCKPIDPNCPSRRLSSDDFPENTGAPIVPEEVDD